MSCLAMVTACSDTTAGEAGQSPYPDPGLFGATPTGSVAGTQTTAPEAVPPSASSELSTAGPASATRAAGNSSAASPGAASAAKALPAEAPDALDPQLMSGTNSGVTVDASRLVFATWPVVAGKPDLNSAMVAETRSEIARLQGSGAREVNRQWSFVAVSPEILGIRMTTLGRFGNGIGTAQNRYTYATRWYDTSADAFVDAPMLFSSGQIENVRQEVVRQVSARTATPEATVDARINSEALDALSFDAQTGDLIVELDDTLVGTGRQAVRVPIGQVETRLSDLGRKALDASRRPRPVTDSALSPETEGTAVPEVAADCRRQRCVALIFAAGPSASTSDVLSALSEAGAPATFFPVSSLASVRPDLVRQARLLGHQIGNGTGEHLRLPGLTAEQQREQLRAGAETVTGSGATPATVLLPPYSVAEARTVTEARQLSGAPPSIVRPTVDSGDWSHRDPDRIVQTVRAGVQPGSMVLLRDSEPATARAIAPLVEQLKASGYTLVTVDRLLAPLQPAGGRIYTRGAVPAGATATPRP